MELQGGCLCGAVRYRFVGEPVAQFCCNCRDCQKSGGSITHYGVMVPRDGFSLDGPLSTYASPTDAGRTIKRNFCPTCGSGLMNELENRPEVVVLKAGTLDEIPDGLEPRAELYTRSKPSWFKIDGEVRSFEGSL